VALIGNCSVLHKSPAKYTTGTVGFNDRANWNKPGMMRSRGDLTVSLLWKYDAVPSGFYAGRAFFPPQKAGRITSRQSFSITGAASGALGLPGAAAGSLTIDATAVGGLIAGGVASGTISITGSASIAGLAAGSASGTMAITGSAAIGATAWGVANGGMVFSGAAQPSALGYMTATTIDNSVLTPAAITSAVWGAQKTDFNDTGTMGNALNNAASGGVDYSALATAVWANATRTLTGGAAPTEAQIAAAIRVELSVELARITKLAALSAIDATLVVTPTTRTAGTIAQTISTVGDTTTVS